MSRTSASTIKTCWRGTLTHPAIGVRGPKFEFVVERGKIREFAQAIGAEHDAYLSVRDPVVPPTFLTIAGRLWGYTFDEPRGTCLAEIDFDRSLLLNAEEEFEYFGDLPKAGMRLQVYTEIKDVYEKRGKRGGLLSFVIIETVFESETGQVIAVQRQTVVKTETAPG